MATILLRQTDRLNTPFFKIFAWSTQTDGAAFTYMRRFVFEMGATMIALPAKAVRKITTEANFRKRRTFWIVLLIGVIPVIGHWLMNLAIVRCIYESELNK